MNAIARFLWLLLLLPFCTFTDAKVLHRDKRGTRNYKDLCVDLDTTAVRETGETWLRWKGQKVEFCRCASKARARCHYIPITNPVLECVQDSGQSYRGTQSVSKNNAKCLPWDSPAIYQTSFIQPGGQMPESWASEATATAASCGQRTLPIFRILGGQFSDIRQQPWQAAITVHSPRTKTHNFLCGGVLIDSCWLLSAAHCFQERFTEDRIQVILGRTFRLQNSSSEQIFDVEKYWIHEQYNDVNYDNDIALLKLKSEDGICAINSPEVLPVCLPDPGIVLPDWIECEISGYGKEEEFSPFYSERIKQGHVRVWPQEKCVPEKISGRELTLNMLCAGDTRGLDDACKGDSGGPLVCEKDKRMTLIGLISWGDGCGKKDTPGVYTRVTKYTNWISNKMNLN
ncbi:Salivary plasminogen activator alpha 1 [Bagarius yarrelli]|uniref:Salivary plasminogen activator alpha 1 n=1 Tax=Bagarius yarrelli TaxID=175774 RepID=A0A556V950_BAGYA|nr:Salivary plasminogen activator alpha 1 [Bagarius yarrelli]